VGDSGGRWASSGSEGARAIEEQTMTHSMQADLARIMKRYFHCAPGCIAFFLLATLVFSLYPQLDLWVSHFFYANNGSFPANEIWLVKVLYHGTMGRSSAVCFFYCSFDAGGLDAIQSFKKELATCFCRSVGGGSWHWSIGTYSFKGRYGTPASS